MCNFQNPMHPSFQYYHQFDHVIEDFLVLIAKMHEKKNQQWMQNIQMMRSEPHEDNPSINILTRSGAITGEDKVRGKQ